MGQPAIDGWQQPERPGLAGAQEPITPEFVSQPGLQAGRPSGFSSGPAGQAAPPYTGPKDPMREMYPWLFRDDFKIKEDPYKEDPYTEAPYTGGEIDTEEALRRREGRAEYEGGGYRRRTAGQDPYEAPLRRAQAQGHRAPAISAIDQGGIAAEGQMAAQAAPPSAIKPPGGGGWIEDPYNIELTPLYQFKKKYGERDLKRQLAATGQLRSSYGMNTMMRFYDKILAETEQEIFQRRKQREDLEYQRGFQKEAQQYGRGFQEEQQRYGRALERETTGYGRQFTEEAQQYGREFEKEAQLYGRQFEGNERGYQRALEREQIARAREQQLYGRRFTEEQQLYGRQLEREQTGYGRWLGESERGYQRHMQESERGYQRQLQETERDYQRRLQREQWQQGLKEQQLSQLSRAGTMGLQGATASAAGAEQASRQLQGLSTMAGQLQGQTALGKGQAASGIPTMLGGIGSTLATTIGGRSGGWGRSTAGQTDAPYIINPNVGLGNPNEVDIRNR